MKQYFGIIFLMCFFAFLGNGCKDDETESIPYLEVAVDTVDFTSAEGSKEVTVSSNLEWQAEGNGDWLDATGSDRVLTIHVQENTETTAREAQVTVSSGSLTETVLVRQLGTEPALMFSTERVEVDAEGGEVTVDITTNANWEVMTPDWIEAPERLEKSDSTVHFVFSFDANITVNRRDSSIVFREENTGKTDSLRVSQLGLGDYTPEDPSEIADDILVEVAGAETTASGMNGYGIELTYDGQRTLTGDARAYYASAGNLPVTLTYYFEDVSSINYLVYYPAGGLYYGQWGEVEVWARCEGETDFSQVMTMDCGFLMNTITMSFPSPLENPEAIQIVVNTTDGGYISCAEVEFYQMSDADFDPLTLFTDETCSELRADVTQADIDSCQYAFYKNIAMHLMAGTYPSEFRIQTYRAYPNSAEEASENKIQFAYSRLDNPTGISVSEGEEVVVFVGPMGGQAISIGVQNLDVSSGDGYGVTTYGLTEGVNKITMGKEGLLYVMYNTSDYETAPEVKIHIASGEVNGYFDVRKHTAEDWDRLFSVLGPNTMFDIVGNYAHLTFPRNLLVLSNGADLIEIYDEMVEQEQVFMGLRKYDRMFGNRMYFHVMYSNYMYATTYHTAYNSSTLSSILNANNFKTGGYWGPAHEVGHCNQTRGLVWVGMTEVTNNILALHVQTYWGNESRLISENRYETAMTKTFSTGQAHCQEEEVFCQLVPFWQLELYMNKVLGNSDFYKDVFEHLRTNPTLSTAGDQQTEFVANCSEQAGLNLFDFFERWGFLTPIDEHVGDYSGGQMTVTEARVEEIRSRVEEYPKPAAAFEYITDENYELFQVPFGTVSVGSVSVVGGTEVSIEGCSNAVAYEVYNEADSLLFVSPAATDEQDVTFTLTTSWAEGFKVYAIAADGSRTEITAVREE